MVGCGLILSLLFYCFLHAALLKWHPQYVGFFFFLQNDEIQHIPIAKQYSFVLYAVMQVIYVKSIN